MKVITGLLALLLAANTLLTAQNPTNKTQISFGGGFENFNGDMGNTYFTPGEEVYGFFYLDMYRYLNASFDAGFSASKGEIGRCLEADEIIRYNSMFMMRARFGVLMVNARYKFNNGYFLPVNAPVQPYFFAGAGICNFKDIWNHTRVNEGNYAAANAGAGLKIRLTNKVFLQYQLGFGFLNSDLVDFRQSGHNDRYMQNTFSLGFNFK